MVKAKECCCGCSLRTGTLILLWTALIIECIAILGYLTSILYTDHGAYVLRSLYFLIVNMIGASVSVLGIYGIQKNIPQYLNGQYYYLCYYVIYWAVVLVVLIVYPSLYYKISIFGPSYRAMGSRGPDFVLVVIVLYFFIIALATYFALIVRSLRDYMMRNKLSRASDTEIPDPRILGYNVA